MRAGWVLLFLCSGCSCSTDGDWAPMIFVDVPAPDVGPTIDAPSIDAPRDVRIFGDPVASCGTVGTVGGACRRPGDTCASGLVCRPELMIDGAPASLRTFLSIPPGEPDPDAPGFHRAIAAPAPELDVPFHAFTNALCTAPCDVALERIESNDTGELDTCGHCAACTTQVGQLGVVESWELLPPEERTFGEDTGFCRPNCVFDPRSTGGCPGGFTCDPGTLVCVEACQTDVECQLTLERTSAGELVSVLDAARGTCNPTTGRCVRGMGTDGVGRMCTGAEDCSVDVGVCWAGGTCAEFACASAIDTTPSGICDGGRGLCFGNVPDGATVCIDGCTTPSDCNPGSACVLFRDATGMPVRLDGFVGYFRSSSSATPPGETAERVVRAALLQYPHARVPSSPLHAGARP
jgi:hypothetical protein